MYAFPVYENKTWFNEESQSLTGTATRIEHRSTVK